MLIFSRLLTTEIYSSMHLPYQLVMDHCICSVHNVSCTNVQFIIFIFACFYICAVSVIFSLIVLARNFRCVVLVCFAAVVLGFIVYSYL